MNKKVISLLTASLIAISSLTAVTAQTNYTDVANAAPYADAVEYCQTNGLMVGTSATEFSPNENTSRAMLMTILYRNEGSPSTSGTLTFSDIENSSWYYNAILWAVNSGLAEGYNTEQFGPGDTLTKEQILSVLWRADGQEIINNVTLPYTDTAQISDYAENAIFWAYSKGIIDDEENVLSPQTAVTRSDMAVIIYRYLTNSDNSDEKNSSSESPKNETPDVHVRFGRTEFDVVLYNTTTKDLLMSQLSENEMLLPTSYDMDNVCKYYDIPHRYLAYMGIETENTTTVHAGDMLIDDNGRLFLFYKDTELDGKYMRVGYVSDMTGLADALGSGSINFYVSEYIGSEDNSEPVSYNSINLTSSITQLDTGFSAVRYEGDDWFENFLEQGGASSDNEVIRFLQGKIGSAAEDLGLNIGGFACSTITSSGENMLFGRNFDWYNCNALVTVSKPKNGYASIATANTDFIKTVYRNGFDNLPDEVRTIISLYAPLDGMNEKGLCAAVLMIQDANTTNQSTGKNSITTTTAIRMLLNKAATVDEAVEMLSNYDFHSSFGYTVHFALSDASGKSVAVEYVNNEMVVTETPILTNFYITPGDKYGIGTAQSHTRFETLQTALSENSAMNSEDIKNALESVSKHHFNDGETTEWSIVYDKTLGIAEYFHRENFNKVYTFEIK